ncbi:site-specific integrase [Pseudoalteromonas denitrificans]|uniref:Phage integrase family protein n=1 Tax=Pseudoalteromonas denitrificans DSM 6059 TaxID=1123010 RepID=A0A1I1IKW1_9GAMM|nr:site-specific integrase [Pseudoalteromonas denitrificans]SFC36924.1 Phage integrase family protein [Pseudoalteromonas denitrificans DSM 6059]
MRKIIFNHTKDGDVPIPYYKGGEVQTHLLDFLICRYHYRTLLRAELRSATPITIKNIAHHVAYLINIFEENEDEHGNNSPIDYREATFELVSQIITSLHDDYEWAGESLKIYAGSWRLFYEFLTIEGVNHNMVFPEKTLIQQRTDKDDDFLSHTRKNVRNTEIETAVPDRYCVKRDDYRNSIISMEQWFQLYAYLYKVDPVYAVMAATMMQTFLRIGGVMQFPNGITKSNKHWKRYAQLKQSKALYQRFNYIKKGQSPSNCMVHVSTMKMIFNEYLEPLYQKRQELYLEKYITKKNAKKQNRDSSSKFTWLNKNGTPVSMRELQDAFKKASDALDFEVTPHTLRHTGATQLLYRWGKEKGIEITDANSPDIHSWLQYQLGHQNLATTKLYVTTVHRLQSENVIFELLATTLPTSLEGVNVTPEAINAFERAKEAQDEFMTGRIKDENYPGAA